MVLNAFHYLYCGFIQRKYFIFTVFKSELYLLDCYVKELLEFSPEKLKFENLSVENFNLKHLPTKSIYFLKTYPYRFD